MVFHRVRLQMALGDCRTDSSYIDDHTGTDLDLDHLACLKYTKETNPVLEQSKELPTLSQLALSRPAVW